MKGDIMARKRSEEQPKDPLRLTIPQGEARQRIAERIEKGRGLLEAQTSSVSRLEELQDDYYKWSDYNKELLKQIFSNDSLSEEYSHWVSSFGFIGDRNFAEKVEKVHDDLQEKIRRLESISERLELIPISENIKTVLDQSLPQLSPMSNKVFVVHGHDEGAREMTARFLERLHLEPIILHEKASRGRTIIEKLEHYADAAYAVVLLTPDDEGREKSSQRTLRDRARQNVILELGYFIGQLGRSRVCALHRGDIEIPTDYLGVMFVSLDEGGGWQLRLARELKAAGFNIDMNMAV